MVLVNKYRLSRSGNSNIITVPPAYIEEMGLVHGDKVKCYRDGDRLIYVAEKAEAEKAGKEKGDGN